MKNCASEIYVLNHALAYQHAFGYIRQLAILLRNSMKLKSKVSHSSFLVDNIRCFSPGGLQASLQLAICPLHRFLVDNSREGM